MRSIPEPGAIAPAPNQCTRKNPLSPKKLLLTKWTAKTPRNREKHFVLLRVIEPEPPSIRVEQVELEAVHSKQVYLLHWRELTDATLWRQGWVWREAVPGVCCPGPRAGALDPLLIFGF